MNRKLFVTIFVLLTLALAVGSAAAQDPRPAVPQTLLGAGFTYQGQLKNASGPVNGTCDFQFSLWDAAGSGAPPTGGAQLGTTQSLTAGVTNGLFTVVLNDAGQFGASAFTGEARWLQIAVRCPAGSGAYTTLSPRQAVLPAPLSLAMPGLYTRSNATSPNLIGGYSGNIISPTVVGGTIGGGGLLNGENVVREDYGTIGGGNLNLVSGNAGTVGGGSDNAVTNLVATISGGQANTASGGAAAVGGGKGNIASGLHATVPGGALNTAQGEASLAAGTHAQALHTGTFVWGDWTEADFASTGNNQFLIRANGGVGINTNVPTRTLDVNGVIGVFDGGTRTYYGGLASEVNGALIELGVNDSSTNRFGGVYGSAAQGGLIRVDARAGANLFQFLGRPAGSTAGVVSLAALNSSGVLTINGLGSAGATALCRNASNQISACSSSGRYKSNIHDLRPGLDMIEKLRPVTFNWTTNGEADLGLVAEEVNQVWPVLTTLNQDGQIEGVKYDRISTVLVKAVQEQQKQIAELKAQNTSQQQVITQLKNGAAPEPPVNVFNVISVLALGGVIVIGLRQKRRGQA
jgi:hypothetical protein